MTRARTGGRRQRIAALAVAGLVLTACTDDPAGEESVEAVPGPVGIGVPSLDGAGSIAPEPRPSEAPSMAPDQASDQLAGAALPTSQWWTSALTGPLSQPLWARPLAVQAGEDGLAISSQRATVSEKAVVTPFVPSVTVPGRPTGLTVTGYGAFDVRFDVAFDAGRLGVTVVQGSPMVWLSFEDGCRPRSSYRRRPSWGRRPTSATPASSR
jgi:endo-1,3(4)-beta-glucanase